MTPAEALARIAAHCDELETDAHPGRLIAQVRAVLAEVTPETGGTLDRDQAREVLTGDDAPFVWTQGDMGPLLDTLAGCVRPATIDRDALIGVLAEEHWNTDESQVADRILALVRPAAGVTLTPEDIPRVVYALRNQDHTNEADWQLAARLGAP